MSKMDRLNKLLHYNYYYILPFTFGIFTGFFMLDSRLLSIDKKISMALAVYYEKTGDQPIKEIVENFPDVPILLKKTTITPPIDDKGITNGKH